MSALQNPATSDDAVWKALSDPTRRRILDLLRQEPLPVGRLASRFELSRFGVMKHLRVLQQAGLVLVERRGRENWNRVNPVPIRALYRRWIHPFEEAGSDQLLRLKQIAEQTPYQSGDKMTNATLTTAEVLLEVEIAASPETVWSALVEETSSWWHPDFYVKPGTDNFTIEPHLGGRVFEDWGDGNGLVWGTVLGVDKGRMLQAVGDTTKEWGGPSRGFLTWRLEPQGNGTLLRFEHSLFGNIAEKTRASLAEGWQLLIGECLKTYAEGARAS